MLPIIAGWLETVRSIHHHCPPTLGMAASIGSIVKNNPTALTLVMPHMICNGFLAVLATKLIRDWMRVSSARGERIKRDVVILGSFSS